MSIGMRWLIEEKSDAACMLPSRRILPCRGDMQPSKLMTCIYDHMCAPEMRRNHATRLPHKRHRRLVLGGISRRHRRDVRTVGHTSPTNSTADLYLAVNLAGVLVKVADGPWQSKDGMGSPLSEHLPSRKSAWNPGPVPWQMKAFASKASARQQAVAQNDCACTRTLAPHAPDHSLPAPMCSYHHLTVQS